MRLPYIIIQATDKWRSLAFNMSVYIPSSSAQIQITTLTLWLVIQLLSRRGVKLAEGGYSQMVENEGVKSMGGCRFIGSY